MKALENCETRIALANLLALAVTLPFATLLIAQQSAAGRDVPSPRPQSPCGGGHDWATWRHLLFYRLLPNLWRKNQPSP